VFAGRDTRALAFHTLFGRLQLEAAGRSVNVSTSKIELAGRNDRTRATDDASGCAFFLRTLCQAANRCLGKTLVDCDDGDRCTLDGCTLDGCEADKGCVNAAIAGCK
jgi:hypothetical protein